MPSHVSDNSDFPTGFDFRYDKYRPAPPDILADVLFNLIKTRSPQCVVDIGCGTGLSTFYWSDRVDLIVGIDPSTEMLRQASIKSGARNIVYREGFSHQTGLPDASVQIVTCSQALHWMEPMPTFREVARILVSGGVFAAYDYDWPPTTSSWEADKAYEDFSNHIAKYEVSHKPIKGVRRWDKSGHLDRMRNSGCFRYAKEIVLHHIDRGNAERMISLLISQGGVKDLLESGFTEQQLGIDSFREQIRNLLGEEQSDWYWSSRLRVGVV